MLRSIPTIAPTKALTTTRSENCAKLARRPSRTVDVGSGSMGLLTAVSSEDGRRRPTLHGQTGRPPIRETFAEPLRAAAVRLEYLDLTMPVDAVGTPALGDV